MIQRRQRLVMLACALGAFLGGAPAWGAGVRANVVPSGATTLVEILLSYDAQTVDTHARRHLADMLEVPITAVAEPVQVLFSAGLVLTWDPAVVSFQSFAFDPESPATLQFTCPDADPGCDDFDPTPEPGRMGFGVGVGDFDGIATSGEDRVGTLTFQVLGPGNPAFLLDVDADNQFANAPRLRLLDRATSLGIDLCTGQPVPDPQTAPCLDSLAFAYVEYPDDLRVETYYGPEPEATLVAAAAFASLAGLARSRATGRSRPRA